MLGKNTLIEIDFCRDPNKLKKLHLIDLKSKSKNRPTTSVFSLIETLSKLY